MTHFFDTAIAEKYGVNAAILFQNINYWCEHNRANGTHFYDGLYWTYNSAKAFAELFPYMSEKQIRSALQKLIDDGIIAKGHYSVNSYDRTTWYAVTEKGKCILPQGKMDVPKKENGSPEKGKSTIANINPDGKTQIITAEPEEEEDIDLDTTEAYVTSNINHLSSGNLMELEGYMQDMSDELIRYAVDEAVANGVRTWAYVRKILNNLLDNSITTVGEARAASEQRKRKQPPAPYYDDTNPALKDKFY